jgi:hypothetical protein
MTMLRTVASHVLLPCTSSVRAPMTRRQTLAFAIALACVQLAPATTAHESPDRTHIFDATQPSGSIVKNCNDSGPGSLREAVADAPSGDLVDLTLLPCSTITLTTGAIHVARDLSIGYNPSATTPGGPDERHIVTIDGGGSDRIFDHTGTDALTLIGLVLHNGSVDGNGGCVRSDGYVTLYDGAAYACHARDTDFAHGKGGAIYATHGVRVSYSSVSGNSADGTFPLGGGIFSRGYLKMHAGLISGNSAVSDVAGYQGIGGGAYVAGELDMAYSSIVSNNADLVGGIDVLGFVDASNATISDNTAMRIGGVLALDDTQFFLSTITANVASQSEGGLEIGATTYLNSSIVAGNLARDTPSDITRTNGGGDFYLSGNDNIIIASTVAVPAGTSSVDPMLLPLTDYGSALLHPLAAGSPAIDAGENLLGLSFDQRGSPNLRTVGAAPDIGAFELGPADEIFAGGFDHFGFVPAPRPSRR